MIDISRKKMIKNKGQELFSSFITINELPKKNIDKIEEIICQKLADKGDTNEKFE